jgi:SOS-response transcriptional repressor LexA
MSPIIKKGDIVLYTSACVSYREGSLVVVHKPNGVLTVRRIYLYEGDPTFILAADGNVPPETLKKDQLKSVVIGRPVFVQRNIENA